MWRGIPAVLMVALVVFAPTIAYAQKPGGVSTAMLSFAAGKFDTTFPYEVTIPLMKDVASQIPGAICDLSPEMQIVWEIDRKLQQDVVRPMLYCQRSATCCWPEVKGLTIMVNSIFNGWRMKDVWLDR